MENIADYLFARRARSLPPEGLAEVFARLIWTMDDNGDEIIEAMRRWSRPLTSCAFAFPNAAGNVMRLYWRGISRESVSSRAVYSRILGFNNDR